MVRTCKTFFAATVALLQLLYLATAQTLPPYSPIPQEQEVSTIDADIVEQEAIKLGFNWPMMELKSLVTNKFLSSIDSHDLSVGVFHTKIAPVWPLVRAVLKTVNSTPYLAHCAALFLRAPFYSRSESILLLETSGASKFHETPSRLQHSVGRG